eukprot:maker-scaffold_20-snap-gene-4.47-mRNA-1 protein AED:0.10 eAED:0.10 QI:307/0.9/0.90/1/0.5/0.45/11/26/419
MTLTAPGASPLQSATTKAGTYGKVPEKCLVTGGSGFVGLRLVEMLIERGAEKVIALDIVDINDLPAEAKKTVWKDEKIQYVKADITNFDQIIPYFTDIDCVFHIAAAVGPFHPKALYDKVNYIGTKNVVHACDMKKVKKFVMSSSPSTRMNGENLDGPKEEELPSFTEMQGKFLQAYAESKFKGEAFAMNYSIMYARDQAESEFYAVAVAPHQVYGPRDNLFLPNLLEAAASGKLRIFGDGESRICFTHVDNYCHGLIIAAEKLFKGSKVLGKFYIVTDGNTHPYKEGYLYFWKEMDRAFVAMGFESVQKKIHLPRWFLMPLSYVTKGISTCFKINLRLTPFTVRMLTMHRWFNITAAEEDLDYKPIISYEEGWIDTIEWFKKKWLPSYLSKEKKSFATISKSTQNKIEIQAKSGLKKD